MVNLNLSSYLGANLLTLQKFCETHMSRKLHYQPNRDNIISLILYSASEIILFI